MALTVRTKPKAYTESIPSVYVNEDVSKYPEELLSFHQKGNGTDTIMALLDCAVWPDKVEMDVPYLHERVRYRGVAANLILFAVKVLKERYPTRTVEWSLYNEQDTTTGTI